MAGSLNKVMLIGRLGHDPELRYTQSGSPVSNFNLATSEFYQDQQGNRQERTEWHRVVVFGRQAETVTNYLAKGRMVYVEGRLQTRKWQDQQGQDRYTTEIVAQNVQFLDSKGQGYEQAPRPEQGQQPQARQQGGPQGGGGQQYRGGGQPQSQPQRGAQEQQPAEDYGPVFPSEASGMDEVPF